jgi:hypothetical protein
MTALTASLNAKAAIQSRVRSGRVLSWAPFLILSVRLLLALLAQGLVAALLWLQGVPNPWQAAAPWWTVSGTLIDLGCLVILRYLTCREEMRLGDLISIERSKLWGDLLLGVGLSLLYVVVGVLGGVGATLVLYGAPQPPRALMGGLPVWATLYSLLIWPMLWGITEEMTYQGYALPRLEVLTAQTWLAVLLVTVGFGLQHIALPSIVDGRYMLWRFLPSLLLGLLNAVVYLRLRRLLPLIIGHWAANALSVLTLAVLPMLQ